MPDVNIHVISASGKNKSLYRGGIALGVIRPGTILKEVPGGFTLNDTLPTVFGEQLIVADQDRQRSKSIMEDWTIDENMVAILPRSGEFINIRVEQGSSLERGSPMSRNDSVSGVLKLAMTDGSEEIVGYSDVTRPDLAFEMPIRIRVA